MSKFIDRTSLKRNKRSFESTALNSIQQNRTILKSQYKFSSTHRLDDARTKHHLRMESKTEDELKGSIQIKSKISQIAINIIEEEKKCCRENGSKFMRHFYYRGVSRVVKQPIVKTPDIMNKFYQEQHIKRHGPFSPPVSIHHGYLKQINCVYYTVQGKIIFIKAQDLINHNQITDQTLPHVVYEVRSQVITVFELPKNNLLFQGYENIIVVVYLWEMEFYAWESDVIIKEKCMGVGVVNQDGQYRVGKLKSLNYIYKFPVERVKSLGCAPDGRIFYFDDKGVLYQITPEQQTKFLICKTGRYTIKNYLNTSPNTLQLLSKNRGRLAPILNLASNICQLSKYLLSSHIEAQIVFCDHRRQLLFGLLRKQIKLLFGQQVQVFIVCYCIKNRGRSKLVHKISQQWLVENYLQHSPSNQPNKNYQIHSISPAPAWHQSANLTINTKSGIKILIQILPNQSRIVQIIRPADHQIFQSSTPLHLNLSSISAYSNQYAPKQINQYTLHSTCDDEQRMIYTVSRGANNYSYAVDRTYFGGGIDINMRGNAVDVDIYKQSSWKVGVHRISASSRHDQQIRQYNSNYRYQLSSQVLSPPHYYIFLNQSKLQLVTYLRPIDILYTTITCLLKNKPYQQQQYRTTQQLMSKQRILVHLFVTRSMQFSLVSNVTISQTELCAMLLQIVVDEGAVYEWSGRAAEEIDGIWKQVSVDLANKYPADSSSRNDNMCSRDVQNIPYINRNKQLSKHAMVKQQCRQQLQRICSSAANSILQKLNTIIMYTSKLVHPIWTLPLQRIPSQLAQTILAKIQHLQKYLHQSQSSMKAYNQQSPTSTSTNTNTNKQLQQVQQIVSNIRQLLLIIIHVPIPQLQVKFCDCLLGCAELQQCIFEAIRKQYKYYVINMWRSLFPSYISQQLMKTVILYGQLEQIADTQHLLAQLQHQQYVSRFPVYFVRYLRQGRKIDIQHINAIIKNNPTMKYQQYMVNQGEGREMKGYRDICRQRDRADYQFLIPGRVKEIVDRHGQVSGELNQSDIEIIISTILDTEATKQLTITNKQSLLTYISTHLPSHPKLNYLAKCISIQYELYRYYIKSIQPPSTSTTKHKIFNRILQRSQEQPTPKYNEETMELLRYRTVVDPEQLRKLVWATADYWLMTDFLVVFQEIQELRIIFKRVCEQFQGHNSRKYSSFAAFIQQYLLNFAIKSKFDQTILSLICQVIDQYLQSQPKIKKTIRQWISFTLPTITDKLIWLPKLLIKIGYKPELILTVYFQHIQAIFNKNVPLPNQILYGIKFLNCYILVDNYVPNQIPDFHKIVSNQLNFLQDQNNVTEKMQIGLKKMLNMLHNKRL